MKYCPQRYPVIDRGQVHIHEAVLPCCNGDFMLSQADLTHHSGSVMVILLCRESAACSLQAMVAWAQPTLPC